MNMASGSLHLLSASFSCGARRGSFFELIISLHRRSATLTQTVCCPQYATAAAKALSRNAGVYCPPEDDLPQDLQAADREMEVVEMGLFNIRSLPPRLTGCKKYAIVHQDIMSSRFFEALQLCVLCVSNMAPEL
jgi:hypothetical protein